MLCCDMDIVFLYFPLLYCKALAIAELYLHDVSILQKESKKAGK